MWLYLAGRVAQTLLSMLVVISIAAALAVTAFVWYVRRVGARF